ncbi:hypothetical protein [Cytobacillus praedii]|uniref:hypothetical protein n=1 Tax=Cytobacillus praedii TaxID=1742358 RepID=UPI002E1D1BBC
MFGDLSICRWDGLAEYAAVPEHALALKPHNVSFEEEAASQMAGVTALHGLRDKGKIKTAKGINSRGNWWCVTFAV